MNAAHVSDEELQVFVTNPSLATPLVASHMEGCEHCRLQAEAYRAVISAIAKQDIPVFDAGFADQVLKRLPAQQEKPSLPLLTMFMGAAFAGIVLFVFRKNFIAIASGSSVIFLALGMLCCVSAIIIKIIAMYKKFRYNCNLIY